MKKPIQLVLAMLLLTFAIQCSQDDNKVSKSTSDGNLLLALVQAQEVNRLLNRESSQIEIRGAWNQSSCSSGTCGTTVSAKVYIDTDLGSQTGFFYQENPPTCFTGGGCTTANGAQFSSFFPANYSIVEYDNTARELFYQNRSSKKFAAFVWVIQDGETLICDVFNAKDTLAEAKTDLRSRQSANTVSTSSPKSRGCNGNFAFNIIRKQE
ncbi:putative lipoprotein [Leptospira ryugenii]|uniref:Putative lipoprotein n=1 Tax=Leptospira ryugenii TaxID=1917863 RepID=A0A2P2E1X8_9LEPT|nr:hypothetical protein [Leptospira ryugenii]GBF50902.1 putative lipoprotein [Leptospira ryugenii]